MNIIKTIEYTKTIINQHGESATYKATADVNIPIDGDTIPPLLGFCILQRYVDATIEHMSDYDDEQCGL